MYDGVTSNETYTSIGLYVGPAAPATPGAARVAVMSNSKCRILITNNFRAGTDGGGLNVYPHIERGLKQLLIDQIAAGIVSESSIEVEPEEDVPMEKIDLQQRQTEDVQRSAQQVIEPSNAEAQGSTMLSAAKEPLPSSVNMEHTAKVKKTRGKRAGQKGLKVRR